jgi:hypothetical protein
MSNIGHNKKRNAGLLYEFLVRTISRALVEGEQKKSAAALKILKRHFKPGTELYREFRLINSLIKTTVSSSPVAASIINEAKTAACSYDMSVLDREKSLLIKHINHSLKDDQFYDQQINEYKMYATVQTLLNNWRSPSRDKDIGKLAVYEDQLVNWLVSEKAELEDQILSEESTGVSRLLMKIMTKKLNEKYTGILDEGQKKLLKSYVFSTANNDPAAIKSRLLEIKDSLLKKISVYETSSRGNKYLFDKLFSARERLLEENINTIDDETVTRFMLYTKLNSELDSEE